MSKIWAICFYANGDVGLPIRVFGKESSAISEVERLNKLHRLDGEKHGPYYKFEYEVE